MNMKVDRKRIFIFVTITHTISIVLGLAIYSNGGLFGSTPLALNPLAFILMSGLMLAPAVANVATRLITREGWSNTLLRPNFRRGWPFYLAAWFLPVLATIVGGAIYYLLFPGRFDPSMTYARDQLGLIPIGGWADPVTFIITFTGYILLVAPTALPLMFGEEFGWRAYLLPKLMPLGPRKAVLLVGAIWGVWHWPAIFMGYEYGFNYWGAPVLGPILFLVFTTLLSIILTWLTMRSGSVWPAALAHGMTNASVLMMLYFIRGEPDRLIGPAPVGIIGGLGYAVVALLIFFSSRALAPIGSPPAVEPKTVQAAAHQST